MIIASRDHAKSMEAVRSIISASGNSNVAAMDLNLGSLDSVRRFEKDFAARALPPIGAIVCNAGIQVISGVTYNDDGYETTFAVNHLGHFLLVNLLLQHLSDQARIVVVSSGTHNPDQFTGMPKPDYTTNRAASVARPQTWGRSGYRWPSRLHNLEIVQRNVHLRTVPTSPGRRSRRNFRNRLRSGIDAGNRTGA